MGFMISAGTTSMGSTWSIEVELTREMKLDGPRPFVEWLPELEEE